MTDKLKEKTRYGFELRFDKEDQTYYVSLYEGDEDIGFTNGDTENEALDMMADCFKCLYDIKVPWYDCWYCSLKRFLRIP